MEQSVSDQRNYREIKAKLDVHKTAGVVGIDVAKAWDATRKRSSGYANESFNG